MCIRGEAARGTRTLFQYDSVPVYQESPSSSEGQVPSPWSLGTSGSVSDVPIGISTSPVTSPVINQSSDICIDLGKLCSPIKFLHDKYV